MQAAGWAFLLISFLTIAAVGHSGWIRYQEMVGSAAFSRVQVPDELALAQANPVDWLSTNDRSAIAAGRPKLDAARRYGAFTNLDNLPKLAWLEFLGGDADRSIETFSDAASRQSGRPRALSLFYRGSILNRLGRYEEALSSLDSAAQESSELIAASEEAGVAHWHLGHRDEAVKAWKVAAAGNAVLAKYMLSGALGDDSYAAEANLYAPNDPYYHWMIGLRLADLDMKQPAESHFQRAVQLDPKFILRRKPKS
jgi:tetratricopeptide (TPR) repeat protein